MFNCPRCKAELPGDPRVCPHCGADQGAGSVQPSAYHPTSAAYEANWRAIVLLTLAQAIDSAAAFMVATAQIKTVDPKRSIHNAQRSRLRLWR